MGQIYVKVRDKSTDDNGDPTLTNGTITVITYKAYGHTQDKYELLYQSDADGNQIPGDPNLSAQHRQLAQQKGAGRVVNAGPSESELALKAENDRLRKLLEQQQQATSPEPVLDALKSVQEKQPEPSTMETLARKKPGPKPKKLQEQQG